MDLLFVNMNQLTKGIIMFADLPDSLREKVLKFLQDDNFPAAKELYDAYHAQLARNSAPDTEQLVEEHVH